MFLVYFSIDFVQIEADKLVLCMKTLVSETLTSHISMVTMFSWVKVKVKVKIKKLKSKK